MPETEFRGIRPRPPPGEEGDDPGIRTAGSGIHNHIFQRPKTKE